MSPETDPVAWDVAERIARRALRYVPPADTEAARRLEEDFAAATAHAEELVEKATGLSSSAGRARSQVTDRAGWVTANIASFRRLLGPVSERLFKDPDKQKKMLSPASRAAAGAEVGLLLAWISGRVLGQYDLLPVEGDDSGGDVVYYVGPNIATLERRHGFPPKEFRLWIAIHEVTHRMQFTGVPWMREYFLGLVERGTALETPDARTVLDSLRRAASMIRAGRNPLAEGGVVSLIATSEQLETLREAQALMSLLEGHGEVIMSRAGADEIPGAARFARVLAERRASASGLAKVVQQALGVDAKLRQYAEGRLFIDAVEKAGGEELFSRVWEGPEMLPSLEEIRDPQRWVARVGEVTSTPR